MARFFGAVGFAEENVETSPGVYEDIIVEKMYYGDITHNARRFLDGSTVVDKLTNSNTISILANKYANEHVDAVRYVKWNGALWEISSIEVHSPRLLLRLGGVYNGPTPPTP